MKMKKKTLLAQECEKREQIEGRERKGSAGWDCRHTSYGLAKPAFFPVQETKTRARADTFRVQHGHTARQG